MGNKSSDPSCATPNTRPRFAEITKRRAHAPTVIVVALFITSEMPLLLPPHRPPPPHPMLLLKLVWKRPRRLSASSGSLALSTAIRSLLLPFLPRRPTLLRGPA